MQRRARRSRRNLAVGVRAENVALAAHEHLRFGLRHFEMIGAVLQLLPEVDVRIEPVLGEVLGGHPEGIGLHLNFALAAVEGLARDRVNLGDLRVRHRIAARRGADAMDHDGPAGAVPGAVERIGIADIEREIIGGIRIHLAGRDGIEAFRHLVVALAQLRTELAGPAAHREGLQEGVLPVRLHLPDLELRFLLIGADQSRRRSRRAQRFHLRQGLLRNWAQGFGRHAAAAVDLFLASRQQGPRARRQASRQHPRAPSPRFHRCTPRNPLTRSTSQKSTRS